MALTIDAIYSIRFGPKRALPLSIQSNIARLRITPVPYRPVRKFTRHSYNSRQSNVSNPSHQENWRQSALVDIVRKVREKDDAEYSEIFSIFNKISPGNLERLSGDAIVIMQKRDEQFRLRITTLLFDRAITQPSFSTIMADCAFRINEVIPGVSEDLQSHIEMFPKLYDMTETITFPESGAEGYDDKIVLWMKQKEKRRGYAKFMMELYGKSLIDGDVVKTALDQVVKELNETARQKSSEQTIENTTQFVEFIFEISKKVKGELKTQLKTSVEEIFKVSKEEFKTTYPSMNMKSKFKLEDALKELNKKE
jgi:hypothetical protein